MVARYRLSHALVNELTDLFAPKLKGNEDRQSLVLLAFQGEQELLNQVKWGGSSRAFSAHLVDLVDEYGYLHTGELAVVVLLHEFAELCGLVERDRVGAIIELIQAESTDSRPNLPVSQVTALPSSRQTAYCQLGIRGLVALVVGIIFGTWFTTQYVSQYDMGDLLGGVFMFTILAGASTVVAPEIAFSLFQPASARPSFTQSQLWRTGAFILVLAGGAWFVQDGLPIFAGATTFIVLWAIHGYDPCGERTADTTDNRISSSNNTA